MADEPEFLRIRQELVEYLLGSKRKQQATVERKYVLPDIMPEDLSRPRPVLPWFGRRGPIRRSEIQSVEVTTK